MLEIIVLGGIALIIAILFMYLLVFAIGVSWARSQAIKNRRIAQRGEVFCLVPWPEIDKDGWVKGMKAILRKSGSKGIPPCYWQLWQEYCIEQQDKNGYAEK